MIHSSSNSGNLAVKETPLRFDVAKATKFTDRCVRCISTKGSHVKDGTGVGQGPEKFRLAGARMPPRRLKPPVVSCEGTKQPPRRGEIGHGEYRARESTDLTDGRREAFANTERVVQSSMHFILDTSVRSCLHCLH